MAIDPRLWALIRRFSAQYRLDPRAVAAVSMVEGGGRFGAVGDSGSSYGPFQLHVGGALPPGKTAAWANSPTGIEYAIRRMAAAGAAGLRGQAAVAAIVNRFERPAAPGPEIQRALGYYGQNVPAGGGAAARLVGAAGLQQGNRGAALAALLASSSPAILPAAAAPRAHDTLLNMLPAAPVAAPPALAPLPTPDYSGTLDAIHKRLLAGG